MQNQASEQQFKTYIQAIGRGQKSGRTLSQQEAYDAMRLLIEGKATPEQRGAFLMLLRVREETPEELAGFCQALQAVTLPDISDLSVDLDLGCYAGKRRQLPWFILAAILLVRTGKRLFMHGTSEPDSNRLYLDKAFQQLGLDLPVSVGQARKQLDSHGMTYLPLSTINPHLDGLIQLRAQFGLRSCANTLARMFNPSQAPFSLQGVYHKHLDIKHQKTAVLLGTNDVLCFRGEGGEIEYKPEREVTLRFARLTNEFDVDVPAMQQDWKLKNKRMDCALMIDVWTGKNTDDYANNAVIGTLSIMLMLTEHKDWDHANQQARSLWDGRERNWPYS